jgi:molybdenum cofactor synthesis domain-containing protein
LGLPNTLFATIRGESALARLKGFETLTSVDNALGIFLDALKPKRLQSESIPIADAVERVVAENVVAPMDLPRFDRSAVDGYAIRADNTFKATRFKPNLLKLTREAIVRKGCAKEIWTGNPVPKGATAVVMLEHVHKLKKDIEIITPVTPSENVSRKGEDIKKGETALEAGTRISAHHVGLLAALGISKVDVVRKPRIAIISTGNELVELGKGLSPSQIVNSNRFVLSGLCQELGAEPEYLGIARDDEEEIRAKIVEGLTKADAVITSGGTSVGGADLVPLVISKLDKRGIVVHGVAMRPGMPTALGILKQKPVFVLSGNPVAAVFGFEAFVRPTVLKLLAVQSEFRSWVKAKLTGRVAGALGRRVYLRVKVVERKGELLAKPVLAKGSGLLSSLTKANGYVAISEDREGLEKDEKVTVHLFSPIIKED